MQGRVWNVQLAGWGRTSNSTPHRFPLPFSFFVGQAARRQHSPVSGRVLLSTLQRSHPCARGLGYLDFAVVGYQAISGVVTEGKTWFERCCHCQSAATVGVRACVLVYLCARAEPCRTRNKVALGAWQANFHSTSSVLLVKLFLVCLSPCSAQFRVRSPTKR